MLYYRKRSLVNSSDVIYIAGSVSIDVADLLLGTSGLQSSEIGILIERGLKKIILKNMEYVLKLLAFSEFEIT